MKSNVAPPAVDLLVEEIVEHLYPWRRGKTEAEIKAAVTHELDVLRESVPLWKQLTDRAAIRKHARKLDEALGEVEAQLASAPDTLAAFLFLVDRQSIEEIERAFRDRRGVFIAELRRLREVCTRDFGTHPNYDHAKNFSARFAGQLMRGLSDAKISGSKDDRFRTVAGLAYHAISGEPLRFNPVSGEREPADLKTACDQVLEAERADWLGHKPGR